VPFVIQAPAGWVGVLSVNLLGKVAFSCTSAQPVPRRTPPPVHLPSLAVELGSRLQDTPFSRSTGPASRKPPFGGPIPCAKLPSIFFFPARWFCCKRKSVLVQVGTGFHMRSRESPFCPTLRLRTPCTFLSPSCRGLLEIFFITAALLVGAVRFSHAPLGFYTPEGCPLQPPGTIKLNSFFAVVFHSLLSQGHPILKN